MSSNFTRFNFNSLPSGLLREDEKCPVRSLPYYVPSLLKRKLLGLQKDLNIMYYVKKGG